MYVKSAVAVEIGRTANASALKHMWVSGTPEPFNIQRHLISRKYHRLFRMAAMEAWRHVTIPA